MYNTATVEVVKAAFVAWQRGEINWTEFERRADLTAEQAAAMKKLSSYTPADRLGGLISKILAES
jgi:hypothetical protein